jgi:tRNA A58 N-methylase Trm61
MVCTGTPSISTVDVWRIARQRLSSHHKQEGSVMANSLSGRLMAIVEALPLAPGMRVLEIGCGPGAMAREMARRVGGDGHVLAIDRSATAISQALSACAAEVESGRLSFRQAAAEDFVLAPDETPFDLAVAVRVGALDGRHPEAGVAARARIAAALVPGGKLFIDGGDPLREIALPG